MKKTILLILAAAMILSACTVGPKEEPRETLPTPDASIPDLVVTEPALDLEEPVEPEPDPNEISAPDDEIIPPVESDSEEPDGIDTDGEDGVETVPPEDADIAIEDPEYSVLYSSISLNVRKGPSTDYEVIGVLKEGEAVDVIGYAVDYGWYMIKFGSGIGYVSGSYMTPDDPNPEPDDDYPGIDIDMDRVYEIIDAFAEQEGYWSIDIAMTGYYGDYSAGSVVKMSHESFGGDEYTNEQDIGGHTFTLYTPAIDLYVYTPSGKLVTLRDAYANGSVSDNDLRAISYYFKNGVNIYFVGEKEPAGLSPLEPLDADTQAAINADYEKAKGLEAGTAYIMSYYGTYSGGEAVVMWTYDPYFLPDEQIGNPMTADMKEIVIKKRRFVFGSGSLDITIHTKDGKFVDLQKAYSDGIISDSDLDAMCYYNRVRSR